MKKMNIREIKLAAQWTKFITKGFKRKDFTRDLYAYLNLNFGFIGHYDIDGFYAARFEDLEGRLETVRQIAQATSYNFTSSKSAALNVYVREVCAKHNSSIYSSARKQLRAQISDQIEKLKEKMEALA